MLNPVSNPTSGPHLFEDVEALGGSNISDEGLIAELVDAEISKFGLIGSEPCHEPAELIEAWAEGNSDLKNNDIELRRVEVARRDASPLVDVASENPDNPQTNSDTDRLNDAELSGQPCSAWDTLMSKEVTVTRGKFHKDRQMKRKNTPDDGWNGTTLTWNELIRGKAGDSSFFKASGKEAWGLSRHTKSMRKDGTAYVFGDCNRKRSASSVRSVCALVLDVDSGHVTFEEAVKRGQELDCAFIAYTSFNDQKAVTELKFDDVQRHAACVGEPSLDQVKSYLAKKKNLAPQIVASAVIKEMKAQRPDGWMIIVEHHPISKYRLIFPLAEGDVRIQALATSQREAQVVFSGKIHGLAEMLSIPIDTSADDVSRMFFAPRHLPGAKFRTVIHRAPPISFERVPNAPKGSSRLRGKKRRPDVVTENGTDVSALYDRYAKRWMLADIAEHQGLETTASVNNATGQFHVRCPFADEHTDSSDDGATCLWDADPDADGAEEFARVKCHHNSCEHRHLVDYLGAWIDNGELDPEVLEAPEFMMTFADDQDEEKFFRLTPEESKGLEEARAYLRDHLQKTGGAWTIPDDAVEATISLLEEMGLSDADARQRVSASKRVVMRQIECRQAEANRAPDAVSKNDQKNYVPSNSILAPLYDESLVDPDGFIVKPDEAPEKYKKYNINPSDRDAYTQMRLEIRDQMYRAISSRFDYVVLDGEAKLAIRPPSGQAVSLVKDETLKKLYLNRIVSDEDGSGDAVKVKQIKPSEVFLHARDRATFFETSFEPDPIKAAAVERRASYNLWNGFAATSVEGDWSKLRDHIRVNLCGEDEELFNFVMTWLASIFARPGVKIPSSLAIVGEQGTGKSKVFDWIRRGIGSAALKVSSMRHLTGNFNAHLDGLILLVCEEAFWGGNKSEGGVIKDLISSDTLQIERKYQNLVERPNYVNMVFISNNKWTVPVDGEDARRFLVLTCSDAKKKDAAFFGAIDDQMENGGLEAMVHELMHWDPADVGMTWNDLRYPPVTDALREQVGMGLSGPAERLVTMLENGFITGRMTDGETFRYALEDDRETKVARHHMVAALHPNGERGNLTQEVKDAISKFLGDDADKGETKAKISFLKLEDGISAEQDTDVRVRHIVVPALKDLREILARHGRG
ncbi:MAG: primase-helicase family protein [Pseudomonadota bacterium]